MRRWARLGDKGISAQGSSESKELKRKIDVRSGKNINNARVNEVLREIDS